jgi:hypothetical protein
VFAIRWKVSSLNHEFLQATMMLCLALSRSSEMHSETTNSCPLHRRDGILKTLNFSKGLWEEVADRSIEARRAAKAIATVLRQDSDRKSALSITTSDRE